MAPTPDSTTLDPAELRESPAACLAADLAEAIHYGLYSAGERLPSQSWLSGAYGVSPTTAQRSLAHLARHGLATLYPGRGAYVSDRPRTSAVLRLWRAGAVCSHLANQPTGEQPYLRQAGDLATLGALSPTVLHWMAEQFTAAARQLLVTDQCEPGALTAACDVLDNGADRAYHLDLSGQAAAHPAQRLAELASRLRITS